MSKSFKKDLKGQRFGKLTILEFVPTEDDQSHWMCRCDCGNITIAKQGHLHSGNTRSCGCSKLKKVQTHKLSRTRLYRTWSNMKQRCYNPNSCSFDRYGKKGIVVCDEWLNDFKAFYDWSIENGYDDNLTIDRIDSSGNYCPENCQWITNSENSRRVWTNPHNRKKSKKAYLEYRKVTLQK